MNTHNQQGFMLGYTLFVAAVILTGSVAIIFLTSSRQITTLAIQHSDKALYLADSGIQHALSQLRQNSLREEGLLDIDVILDSPSPSIEYSYYVKLSTFISPAYFDELMVSATSYGMVFFKNLNEATTKYVNAVIQVNTLSDYFIISTKSLRISRGTDNSNADMYGYNLIFLDDNPGLITKVKKADYFNSVQNDMQAWVEINAVPGGGANKLLLKVDLPLLTGIISRYVQLAGIPGDPMETNTTGMLGLSDCTKNYIADLSGESNIYPPANGTGIYYSPDPITIGNENWTTYIHGQIVFTTTETITIKGNLEKCYDGRNHIDTNGDGHIDCFSGWGSEYTNFFSSIAVETSQLGLFSGNDVIVSKTDGSNNVQSILIESTVLASEGYFQADPNINNSASATINFSGSIMIREGIVFSNIYTDPDKRIYQYDTDLKDYQLPHMPYTANIVYWLSW